MSAQFLGSSVPTIQQCSIISNYVLWTIDNPLIHASSTKIDITPHSIHLHPQPGEHNIEIEKEKNGLIYLSFYFLASTSSLKLLAFKGLSKSPIFGSNGVRKNSHLITTGDLK